ncbi:MAG: SDR family oxidoreductase [Gammaproteobacteria bacterium]|nr:SDR family oxidoreductase [Gammaproteobacteria bacterium]
MKQLENKVAIITGASSGIGYEAAKLFASEGASVVLSARRGGQLNDLVGEIKSSGGKAVAFPCDVSREDGVVELVNFAKKQFGGIDIAFNNAGILGQLGPITDISSENWAETLSTNLTGAFYCAKHQIPAMLERGGGSIIFTSTFIGNTVGLPGMSAYAASKAGLNGLTKVLAAEYGEKNIRVNTLIAGGTDTPMSESFISSEEVREYVKSIHALKRTAHPLEIAKAALYLASDSSSFVTGSSLFVDGGASLSK